MRDLTIMYILYLNNILPRNACQVFWGTLLFFFCFLLLLLYLNYPFFSHFLHQMSANIFTQSGFSSHLTLLNWDVESWETFDRQCTVCFSKCFSFFQVPRQNIQCAYMMQNCPGIVWSTLVTFIVCNFHSWFLMSASFLSDSYILCLTAQRKGSHALPQATERPDRPGLPQT